jgi:hypothetical protein
MTDMANPKTKTATYADIEALPPHVTGEILFGTLVTQPRPAHPHIRAASAMGYVLGPPFDFGSGGGPGGWVILAEPEIHLGPHVVVPDQAGWRRARFTDPPDAKYFTVAPDWVCEILSPSTAKRDRFDKRRIYATYAVDHLWLLNPQERLLEVFRGQDKDWLLTHTFADQDDVSAPPFDAITFSLAQLWSTDPA